MPATRNGTAYTVEVNRAAVGGRTRWYVADRVRTTARVPLLLFVHGSGGGYTSLDTTASGEIRDWLVDHGWAVIEADAGGPTNFGNVTARRAYVHAVDWVRSRIHVGTMATIGQSMGGICASWLATGAPFSDRVTHAVIQQGVCDLLYRYSRTETGPQRVGVAYGLSPTAVDVPAFQAVAAGHDPMTVAPSAWAGKSVLHLTDDADATVPRSIHGRAWVAQYGTVADVTYRESSGFGHAYHAGHRRQTYAFLEEARAAQTGTGSGGGGTATEGGASSHQDAVVWRVTKISMVGDDRRLYPLAWS